MTKPYTHPRHAPRLLEEPEGAVHACSNGKTGTDSTIMPYKPDEAKTKLTDAKVTDEIVSAILALGTTRPAAMSALVDLACSDETAKVIAERYALTASFVHYWGKRVGLPKRQRGRRVLLEPTPRHSRILELVRAHGITDAARRVGISRQRAHAVVSRWEPALRGRRPVVKLTVLPRPERHPPRNVVVSFRLSAGDWERLVNATPVGGEGETSGFAKARAIVLRYLSTPGDDESGPANAIVSLARGPANVVDVYDEKAA